MTDYERGTSGSERVLITVISAAVGVLLLCLLAAVWQFWLMQASLNQRFVIGNAILAQHDRLLQLVNEETGIRGYVATGDPRFLDIYTSSLAQSRPDARGIVDSIAVLSAQARTIRRSIAAADALQHYFTDEIALVRGGHAAQARLNLSGGRLLFDRFRSLDRDLEAYTMLRVVQIRDYNEWLARAGFVISLALCAIVLLCGAGFAALWRRTTAYRATSLRDSLTGLSNRRGAIAEMNAHIRRGRSVPFGLVFLDLDGFKKVNDVYGHAAGDGILKRVAERLRAELRDCDTVCRLGGDEFLCVIAPPASTNHINVIAERLRKSVSKPFSFDDNDYVVGCSVGVSMYPDHGDTVELLLARADRSMYQQKFAGRASETELGLRAI